jgi:hypothetical protein
MISMSSSVWPRSESIATGPSSAPVSDNSVSTPTCHHLPNLYDYLRKNLNLIRRLDIRFPVSRTMDESVGLDT